MRKWLFSIRNGPRTEAVTVHVEDGHARLVGLGVAGYVDVVDRSVGPAGRQPQQPGGTGGVADDADARGGVVVLIELEVEHVPADVADEVVGDENVLGPR